MHWTGIALIAAAVGFLGFVVGAAAAWSVTVKAVERAARIGVPMAFGTAQYHLKRML